MSCGGVLHFQQTLPLRIILLQQQLVSIVQSFAFLFKNSTLRFKFSFFAKFVLVQTNTMIGT